MGLMLVSRLCSHTPEKLSAAHTQKTQTPCALLWFAPGHIHTLLWEKVSATFVGMITFHHFGGQCQGHLDRGWGRRNLNPFSALIGRDLHKQVCHCFRQVN